MTSRRCTFGDIKEGDYFSRPLGNYQKIAIIWGNYGPNNAIHQGTSRRVCFADAEQVVPKLRYYQCPGCNSIWTEHDLLHSEGDCPECGWGDALDTLDGE
jgi:hypothetical protein